MSWFDLSKFAAKFFYQQQTQGKEERGAGGEKGFQFDQKTIFDSFNSTSKQIIENFEWKKKKIKEFIDEWIINNRFPYMTTAQVIKEGERREEENGNAKCRPD